MAVPVDLEQLKRQKDNAKAATFQNIVNMSTQIVVQHFKLCFTNIDEIRFSEEKMQMLINAARETSTAHFHGIASFAKEYFEQGEQK